MLRPDDSALQWHPDANWGKPKYSLKSIPYAKLFFTGILDSLIIAF